MNLVHKIIKWEQPKHQLLVFALRVSIGIIVAFKGIIFLSDPQYFNSLVEHSNFKIEEGFWMYYIGFAHLIGGIFLILGFFARVAVIVQLPILIGAVIFVNPGQHGFTLSGEFVLSLFVLCALIYFTFKGPGEISMDAYLRNHEL
ncbi:MAG: DoxX family protein [Chitinophagaceae bacterium]|nr:DoxX family protein [Chitinophagaceae bacterium]